MVNFRWFLLLVNHILCFAWLFQTYSFSKSSYTPDRVQITLSQLQLILCLLFRALFFVLLFKLAVSPKFSQEFNIAISYSEVCWVVFFYDLCEFGFFRNVLYTFVSSIDGTGICFLIFFRIYYLLSWCCNDGRSTLVGQHPMKRLSSVCLSVCLSRLFVHPLLNFLRIGSLVFFWYCTWHLTIISSDWRGQILEKNTWWPEFRPNKPKSGL